MEHRTGVSHPGIYLSPKGVYFLDAIFRGFRIKEAVGPDLKQAEDLLRMRKTEIVELRYFPARAGSSLTVENVLSTYWKEHLVHGTPAYTATVKIRLNHIANYFGSKKVSSLRKVDVDDYVRARKTCRNSSGNFISISTVRDELLVLASALHWCHLSSGATRIPHNPLAGCKFPKRLTPRRIQLDEGMPGEEWERLYQHAHPDVRDVFLALYESGMRPKEIFLMQWEWIERIAEDRWLVRIPREIEKTGCADRRVPVSPRWLESLRAIEGGVLRQGLVYPSPTTGKARRKIQNPFKTAIRRAGLEGRGLTPYCLRRTRLSIWDAVDSPACMHASGHVLSGAHFQNYVTFPPVRLFKLVGIETPLKAQFELAKVA